MGWTAPALARNLDRDPIRELHQGQRPYAPHERAGHMTAPDRVATLDRGGNGPNSGPWIAAVRVLPAFSNWKVAASDRGDEMRMIAMPGFTAEEAVYTSVQIAMPQMET